MNTVNGLPLHILVVHGVVVMIPLTAVVLLLCAWWPAARERLMWPALVLAAVTMGLVPIASSSGEWLQQHVVETPLVAKHTELGDSLDIWVIGMFVLAAAIAYFAVRRPRALVAPWTRDDEERATLPARGRWDTAASVAVPVLAVLLALGGIVQVYRVGDSGAQAVWKGKVTAAALHDPEVARSA